MEALCWICENATPKKCPFMAAEENEKTEQALKSLGATYKKSLRKNSDLNKIKKTYPVFKVQKCPKYAVY